MTLRFIRLLPALLATMGLYACATRPSIPAAETIPTAPAAAFTPIIPTFTSTDFPQEACGYQWAYQDLPELTAQLDNEIAAAIPNATARATAFGENCLGNTGQVIRFLARETDFHVSIPVERLDQYEAFGNWIAQAMHIVIAIPTDAIVGPMPGFVEFRFEKNQAELLYLRVPIQTYKDNAKGLTGESLFRMFSQAP